MFQFYKLYSLYLKKMSIYKSSSTWCLCGKLPRSMLHIAPTPDLWCEVCGRRRRPRVMFSSTSDEEERTAEQRQLMLSEQRRAEETSQGLMRVKVSTLTAKKHKQRHKTNCVKCDGQTKPATNLVYAQHQGKIKSNNRLYMNRFSQFRKPQRLLGTRRDGDYTEKLKEKLDIESVATAPSPTQSSQPACGESLWEQPNRDMPNLVAFAHEVFNRPLHLRKRQTSFYDNLFVSDFIPLEKPITDAAGGAISKRQRFLGRPLSSRYSRPLPPLSQVLSNILAKQMKRSKGGGFSRKTDDAKNSTVASQFPPFDSYEGPSEDALVVESARQMLRLPKALHIKKRTDLPTTRLSGFDSEPSSDCSLSLPFDMPTAPPVERPCQTYNTGAPLRLHEILKAGTQSGLSDTSVSSSSPGSSSHKSVSSTLPVLQQPNSGREGEEPLYEENPDAPAVESAMEPIIIMEKMLRLMEQKPKADGDPSATETDNLESNQIQDDHTESVKVILQFMERMHIEGNDDTHSTLLNKDLEDDLKTSVGTNLNELQNTNDMSNDLPLNFSNKSAADPKYVTGFNTISNGEGQRLALKDTSMWSIISRFFTSKLSNRKYSKSDLNSYAKEIKPLSIPKNRHYGSILQHPKREERICRAKKSIDQIMQAKPTNTNCQKCGLIRVTYAETKKYCRFHAESLISLSSYPTVKAKAKKLSSNKIPDNAHEKLTTMQNRMEPLKSKEIQSFETKKHTFVKSQDSYNISHNTIYQMQVKDKTAKSVTRSEILSNFKDRRKILRKKTKEDVTETLKRCPDMVHFKDSKKYHLRQKKYSVEYPKRSQHFQNYKAGKTIQTNSINDIKETATSSPLIKSEAHKLSSGPGQQDIEFKELLEKQTKQLPKYLNSSYMVKIMETLSFQCSEIIQPKMVYSTREVRHLMNYILKPMILNYSFGLLEFRTPDVQKVFKYSPELISCRQSEESLVPQSNKFRQKTHQRPVWPAHPIRHRKAKMSYKVDNKYFENYNMQTKSRRHENSHWLANKLVQKKIHEMMTKPIKLLGSNEGSSSKSVEL